MKERQKNKKLARQKQRKIQQFKIAHEIQMRQELLFALEKMRVLSVLLLLTDEDLQKSFLSLMRDGYIPKAFKDLFDPEYGESLESFFGDAFESHVLQFLTKSLEFFKSCLFYDEKICLSFF